MHGLRVGHNLVGRVEIARVRAGKGQPLEFDINCSFVHRLSENSD
jgi:hypothetical protein